MLMELEIYLENNRDTANRLFQEFLNEKKMFLLNSEIKDIFSAFASENGMRELHHSPLEPFLNTAQEAAQSAPWIYFALRERVARWKFYRLHLDTMKIEMVDTSEYLAFKERLVTGNTRNPWTLEIDLGPFNREFPKMHEMRSIGRGVEFLNRKLSSQLFQENERGSRLLLDFMRVHQHKGRQLMLNDKIQNVEEMRHAVREVEKHLSRQSQEATWGDVRLRMKELGFESGWGKTVGRMRNMLSLLAEILEAPDPSILQEFLSRIPMIFRIAIISPHGYFCQSNVMGLPDTGGQVVYILDQVRAIEKEMVKRLDEQGFDVNPEIMVVTRLLPEARGTTCDQRIEPIIGTKNAKILRVPFRTPSGEVVPYWISRFNIWPYLERFAEDAGKEIVAEFMNRPDFIIGNYSDGNLVASLLSRKFHVTQCNIAHALEKTKYLLSDLYWKDNDAKHHFSCQFTADLIAMNTADFIITSTYQEIAGTADTIGQYESYQAFTMPDLYRVVNGIDAYDVKFNIVSPGADLGTFFPSSKKRKRFESLHKKLNEMIDGREGSPDIRGVLEDTSKPLLFTIARMDRIKNITGIVECYGRSDKLREKANLLVVSGGMNPDNSEDEDEKDQIRHMHHLMEQYGLDHQVRWCGLKLDKPSTGELYRLVADRRGAFVQPALFEAFGLTIIEAMSTGLPVFATCYGGPLEIIQDGLSGFHINPNDPEATAEIIDRFFEACAQNPAHWETYSKNALKRVEERYTWKLYAERVMTLSRIYGFWKYVSNLERDEIRRYLDMLYGLQYRKLVENVPT